MAIFDTSLPMFKRSHINEIVIDVENYNAAVFEKWSGEYDTLYAVKIEMDFVKCKKKFLGICYKTETYTKWVEVPASIYSPELYPVYWPINMIDKKQLHKKFKIYIPKNIKTEEDWEKYSKEVLKNHRIILMM